MAKEATTVVHRINRGIIRRDLTITSPVVRAAEAGMGISIPQEAEEGMGVIELNIVMEIMDG